MKKLNDENVLFKAEHKEKGTWYFTTSVNLCAYCGISYTSFYMTLKGATKQAKGWKISLAENDGIDPKLIDPK